MTEHANIGPRGIRVRGRLGALAFLGAAVLLAVLTMRDAPLAWTLGIAPLVWLGGLGVFQARAKT
jgi:hypothetical protein